MNSDQNRTPWYIWAGVVILQLIMTQVVTFLFSMFIPNVEQFQQSHALLFALIVGLSFSVGVLLAGWLALKFGWLKGNPKLLARLIGTLMGAYVPLMIALIIYRVIVAGNPFLTVSILLGILGYHIPGWFGKK